MSGFAERIAHDLLQIADQATPSSTAWDSIRIRIEEQTDVPDMEVIMLTPDDNKTPRRTWLTKGAVAVAATVLIIVGIVALTGSEVDVEIATDPDGSGEDQQALGIAQDFVEARNSWDGEAVRSLVADDAVIDGFVSTADEYLTNNDFEQATGWRFIQPECTATVVGPPTEVTCNYTMENAWSRALGVGPFTGSSFEFVIADGQIQQITHDFDTTLFSPQVWDVLKAWVRDTHPADFDIIYDLSGALPYKTPEAVALWEHHTTEFVAAQSNS